MTVMVSWMGRKVRYIEGVDYHGSGEATTARFLSRKDKLVHAQSPTFEKSGLAFAVCGLRYNIYPRAGMRGHKGIPTKDPLTCMACMAEEES